ncbi:uncharacterized protein LOC143231332 [Tachypleus tridentatus]|uniref:uncharacterized protein LOC143231332 n=1 Tax=Tachypleus tridentatus TaxID=6853 RepID=UPI003FD264AA
MFTLGLVFDLREPVIWSTSTFPSLHTEQLQNNQSKNKNFKPRIIKRSAEVDIPYDQYEQWVEEYYEGYDKLPEFEKAGNIAKHENQELFEDSREEFHQRTKQIKDFIKTQRKTLLIVAVLTVILLTCFCCISTGICNIICSHIFFDFCDVKKTRLDAEIYVMNNKPGTWVRNEKTLKYNPTDGEKIAYREVMHRITFLDFVVQRLNFIAFLVFIKTNKHYNRPKYMPFSDLFVHVIH